MEVYIAMGLSAVAGYLICLAQCGSKLTKLEQLTDRDSKGRFVKREK